MDAFCPEIVDDSRPVKRQKRETQLAYNEVLPWQQFEVETFGETKLTLHLDESPKSQIQKEKLKSEDSSSDEESDDDD